MSSPFAVAGADLAERLERLEGIVGRAREVEEQGAGGDERRACTLTERVAALSVRLAGAGCLAPRLVALADSEEDGGTDPAVTRAVLAASASRLSQTAQQLENVHHLSNVADSEQIPDVAATRADLDTIAPLIMSQASAVSDLGGQLESFLEAYNDAAASMSEAVLQLDARIRRLELRRRPAVPGAETA